jgi:uncharacterized protein (DUF58 family)
MRGKYPRELPELTSEFPFGLWKCQKSVAATQELIAWPQCEPWRKPYDHGDRSEECAAQSDERAGNHGDVLGVRPFRHGDQLRNVHWSLSARADELMVKERETASISRAVIRVDLDPSHHAGVGRDHSLERCIRIAAGMCQQFTQQGVPLTLELGSRRLSLSPRRESLAVALDALATAQCEHANAATPCSTRHDASAIYWVTTDLNAHVRVHRRAIVVATGSACQASSDLRTNSACHIARTSTR